MLLFSGLLARVQSVLHLIKYAQQLNCLGMKLYITDQFKLSKKSRVYLEYVEAAAS
jgi:hypothetical protein